MNEPPTALLLHGKFSGRSRFALVPEHENVIYLAHQSLFQKQICNRARLPVVPSRATQDNGFSRCEAGAEAQRRASVFRHGWSRAL